jgi:hypothetical protein
MWHYLQRESATSEELDWENIQASFYVMTIRHYNYNDFHVIILVIESYLVLLGETAAAEEPINA